MMTTITRIPWITALFIRCALAGEFRRSNSEPGPWNSVNDEDFEGISSVDTKSDPGQEPMPLEIPDQLYVQRVNDERTELCRVLSWPSGTKSEISLMLANAKAILMALKVRDDKDIHYHIEAPSDLVEQFGSVCASIRQIMIQIRNVQQKAGVLSKQLKSKRLNRRRSAGGRLVFIAYKGEWKLNKMVEYVNHQMSAIVHYWNRIRTGIQEDGD